MIDPARITDFDRDDHALEEFALFCPLTIATAGDSAARTLGHVLTVLGEQAVRPLPGQRQHGPGLAASLCAKLDWYVYVYGPGALDVLLRSSGARFHHLKASAWRSLAESRRSRVDLRVVGRDDLVRWPGWGLKTASLYLLHSRPGWRGSCQHRHFFRAMRRIFPGVDFPDRASQSRRDYLEFERLFLAHCDASGREPAELDREWWDELRGTNRESA